MSTVLHFTSEQVERSTQLLEEFLATSPDFVAGLIATVDGRLMLMRSRRELGGSRIASMAASLIALSEALGRELDMNPCNHITVSTDFGIIVALRVNDDKHVLALTTAARQGVKLGALLASSRRAAEGLSKIVSTTATG